jgi:FkbM family methyltransferase
MTYKTPFFFLASIIPSIRGFIQREWPLIRARAQFAMMDKFKPLWVDGYYIDDPGQLIGFWQEWFEGRSNEQWQHLVDIPNPLILDIGSSVGVMGWMFKKRWPGATIYAFEPLEYCQKFYDRTAIYDKVYNGALGDSDGTVKLKVNTNGGSRGTTASTLSTSGYSSYEIDVQKFKLDSFGFSLHLIKIDVDGDEMAVIHGGIETCRRCWVLMIECRTNENAAIIATMLGKHFKHLHGDDYMFWGRPFKNATIEDAAMPTERIFIVRG